MAEACGSMRKPGNIEKLIQHQAVELRLAKENETKWAKGAAVLALH